MRFELARMCAPRHRLAAVGILLLTMTLLAACGKIPVTHYYQLLPPASEGIGEKSQNAPPEGLRRIRIDIPSFVVNPPYDQDQIVYRIGRENVEVGFYGYHRWAIPLERDFPIVMRDYLMDAAGGFVTDGLPGRGRADATLVGRVLALEEIDSPEGSHAYFRLELTLKDAAGDAVWSRIVESETIAQGSTVDAVVRGMQAAVIKALDGVKLDLVDALRLIARSPDR
jgi:uncharacterized lipoprotein YmbA